MAELVGLIGRCLCRMESPLWGSTRIILTTESTESTESGTEMGRICRAEAQGRREGRDDGWDGMREATRTQWTASSWRLGVLARGTLPPYLQSGDLAGFRVTGKGRSPHYRPGLERVLRMASTAERPVAGPKGESGLV